MPGSGNHRAAPPVRFAEPVLTVVTVRVDVTVPFAAKAPDAGFREHVGGFAEELTEHPKLTLPEAPEDVTVTVAVPVLPRLIAFGETVIVPIENWAATGEYLTTKASRQTPVQADTPEFDAVVLKP